MTAPVIRWQYAGQTSGPRYEAWREEFGRWWVRADLIPILDDLADCVASEITVSQLSFVSPEMPVTSPGIGGLPQLASMRSRPRYWDASEIRTWASRSSVRRS